MGDSSALELAHGFLSGALLYRLVFGRLVTLGRSPTMIVSVPRPLSLILAMVLSLQLLLMLACADPAGGCRSRVHARMLRPNKLGRSCSRNRA